MGVGVSVLICLALGACVALLARRALRTGRLPVTTDWLDDLSIERYRPMLRLLAEEDPRLWTRGPGFTPQTAARIRAQRCRIVRGYLRSMEGDFALLCTALKVIMAQAQDDRPDLGHTLVRSQITFTFGVAVVRFRLLLYRWGFGRVEVKGLLSVFDGLRLELRALVPMEASIGA